MIGRLLLFLSLLILVGCDDPGDVGTASRKTTDGTQDEPGAWSYEGDTGPRHWADLSPAYSACDGPRQSPIDLTDASPPEGPTRLKLSYTTAEAQIEDTGHGVRVNTSGGAMTIRDTTYELQEVHAHTPSEHTVNGTRYAAEIHLVHRAEDGIAVLGVFVEEGDSHSHLDDWIQGTDTSVSYNAGRLLPPRRSYYTYEGSLTTPPCTEPVRWIVMDTPMEASAEQLAALRANPDGNARPVQSRNDRRLVLVAP